MAAKLLHDENLRMLDRYELIAELASGGMATVYLARLGGLAGFQRLYAIKHLHPYLHGDRQFVQMFLDEARLAAGIHHPNVVAILEVGASDSGYYLVMEYVEGDTLARLLARASSSSNDSVPFGVSVRILLDVLDGLDAAHDLRDLQGMPLGIVHRDVSPQNILVGVDGVAKITDFGVARAASRLNATKAGQLKGKIAYMAPEQAQSGEVDRRTDVFAAGIVLWEALAMRRLFREVNDAATLNRVLFEPIPSVCEFNPAVPRVLDQVVMKALEREPENRFRSCAAFMEALEQAAEEASLLVSVREVSTFVQSTLGQEIQAQRDKVRAWLARSEPSQAWPVTADQANAQPPGPHGVPTVVPTDAAGEPVRVESSVIESIAVAPARSRLVPWLLGAVVAVAVAATVAVLAVVLTTERSPTAVASSQPASSQLARAVSPPTPSSSGSSPPAVSSSPLVAPAPSTKPGPVVLPPPQKTAPKSLPTEKDDMSTNPYR